MTVFRCENRYDCIGIAFVVSLIVGIIAAFLQITGVITLTPIFSIVAFGIAIVYLAVVLLATALSGICLTINEICQKNGCNTGYNFCSNEISYILTAKCHGECKMTAKQCRTRYNKSSIQNEPFGVHLIPFINSRYTTHQSGQKAKSRSFINM